MSQAPAAAAGPVLAYLLLGSNLGDRAAHLATGRQELAGTGQLLAWISCSTAPKSALPPRSPCRTHICPAAGLRCCRWPKLPRNSATRSRAG